MSVEVNCYLTPGWLAVVHIGNTSQIYKKRLAKTILPPVLTIYGTTEIICHIIVTSTMSVASPSATMWRHC